ncbi:hypothetical protein DFH28DRAFT_1083091 [Melampsora americana]|nr:hypothetical protein DFH28DRAFT_1083091 [Melampsora americana]
MRHTCSKSKSGTGSASNSAQPANRTNKSKSQGTTSKKHDQAAALGDTPGNNAGGRKQRKNNPATNANNDLTENQSGDTRSPSNSAADPTNNNSTESQSDEIFGNDVEEFDKTFNLDNLYTAGRTWTATRVEGMINARVKYVSHIPSEIILVAKLAQQNYRKAKPLYAGLAKVKLETLEEKLGKGGKTLRPQDAFCRFMSYGKDSLKLCSNEAGKIWTETCTTNQCQVFHADYFFALAGIPNLDRPTDDKPEAKGAAPQIPLLSLEEEEKYRPIYDKLVDHNKVIQCKGKMNSGKDMNKRSLKRVRQLGKLLARDGKRLKFKFIFLAASAHPPAKDTGAGWSCKYTSVPAITKWADREIGLSPVFATVAQGESMIKAISHNHHKTDRKSKASTSTQLPQPSSVLKTRLSRALNQRLVEVLGYHPTRGKCFPLTPDPVAGLVQRKVPVRIVQEPGSKLSAEDLKVGHKAMHKVHQREWLDDLNSNHHLELFDGSERAGAGSKGKGNQGTQAIKSSKGKGKRASKIKSK